MKDKSDATHYSVNGITGRPARYYFLQSDGELFRWSVKDSLWVKSGDCVVGLFKIGKD